MIIISIITLVTCKELIMKGVRRQRLTGCMTMMKMMMWSASRWGSICRRLRSAAIALIPTDAFHPLRRSPPRAIKLHGLEAKLAFAHALALDNDDNIENDNVDNAVVLPHANKDSTVLQSSHSIHAGGSLSSCEIFSICCCVNISIAVWAGPVVPSMGRLSINGH